MTEQKIVMKFTEQEIRDLDAMATEGYRLLRDDATEQRCAAALAIVHRIDANRRAILAGEPAPDAARPVVVTEDNRIDQIRAVLAAQSGAAEDGLVLDRIRAILDSAPPAPRVWFPGDTVPAGTWVMNVGGGTIAPRHEDALTPRPCVEVTLPTPEEWLAIVDRASAARANTEGAKP